MCGVNRSMSKNKQTRHLQSYAISMCCVQRIIPVTSAALQTTTVRNFTSLIAPSVSHHLTRSICSHLNGKQDNQEKDYEY